MRFALHIALTHLRSRRREVGVSAMTAISVAGVTVGVAALIIVLSVMAGFEVDLRDKILGSNAHVVLLSYDGGIEGYRELADRVAGVPGVEGATPFTYTEMMIQSPAGVAGIILKGIEPERVAAVLDLSANITRGVAGPTMNATERQAVLSGLGSPVPAPEGAGEGEALPGIVIGEELARDLRVQVGDKVHLVNPVGSGTRGLMGLPVPDVKPFRVAGTFHAGMYEYDTKWTYVAIPAAQDLLRTGDKVVGVEATVTDIYGVASIAMAIEDAAGWPYYTRHWKELNRNLFAALKMEKVVMGLILGLIVGVASLNVAGTLILVVLTRGREIAILRAIGATRNQVRAVFMLEGTLIGLLGTALGTALGLGGSVALDRYEWKLDTDVYYVDSLPVVIQADTVLLVMGVALLICFLVTLYPASNAARLDPVEGLRNE